VSLLIIQLILIGLIVVFGFGVYVINMPGNPSGEGSAEEIRSSKEFDSLRSRLRNHIHTLAVRIGERNVFHPESLHQAEDYIRSQWKSMGYDVRTQNYSIRGVPGSNLEVRIQGTSNQSVGVGADYDTVQGSPGANDKGSGVAALIELSRLFTRNTFTSTIRFVAFVNEEPPHFRTDQMGSYRYAQELVEEDVRLKGMFSVETSGYYSDEAGSQNYPIPFRYFYPDTGNFIGFVGNLDSRNLIRSTISSFRRNSYVPSEGIAAPAFIPGVGWSDHWSFWQFGYPAVMITDTAPFRYPHYHQPSDTPDKLDYDRFTGVVLGLRKTIESIARVNDET